MEPKDFISSSFQLMLTLLVQEPHVENHCCRTSCEAGGERNCQCFGAVKRSLHRDSGTWVSVEGCKGGLQGKMECMSSGVASGSVGMGNWVALQSLDWWGGGWQESLGTDRRPH